MTSLHIAPKTTQKLLSDKTKLLQLSLFTELFQVIDGSFACNNRFFNFLCPDPLSYQLPLSPPFAVIFERQSMGWWGRLSDDEKIFVKFKLSSYNKSSESSSSEALSAGSSVLSPIINIFERFFVSFDDGCCKLSLLATFRHRFLAFALCLHADSIQGNQFYFQCRGIETLIKECRGPINSRVYGSENGKSQFSGRCEAQHEENIRHSRSTLQSWKSIWRQHWMPGPFRILGTIDRPWNWSFDISASFLCSSSDSMRISTQKRATRVEFPNLKVK